MVKVFNNGCIILSESLTNGKIIIQLAEEAKNIYCFFLSPNGETDSSHPGVNVLESVFKDVTKLFPQCMSADTKRRYILQD